nr:hypothetical protein [Janthinobacterium sp. Marseille]
MARYAVVIDDLDMTLEFESADDLEEWLDSPEAAAFDYEVIDED